MELANSHILVIHGAGDLRTFKLTKACHTIGRSDKADIFLDGHGCSRHHATLVRMGEGKSTTYLLVDGNPRRSKPSTNGTYINGERITSRLLRHKDRIFFGCQEVFASYLSVSYTRTRLTYSKGKVYKLLY